MALFYRRVCLAALLVLLASLAPAARPALAASLVVTKAADTNDGSCNSDCSLREAITAANANAGADVITFNIPADGANNYNALGFWRITPTTNLPSLSAGGDQILGPSASDAPATAWAHPRIVLDGTSLLAGNGLTITSAGNTISRLTIVNFRGSSTTVGFGLVIDGAAATGNTVEGCYIGVDPSVSPGTSGNQIGGILIANGASRNTIGGDTAAKRNVIAGNGWATGGAPRGQLYLTSSSASSDANVIRGNYFGTNPTGTAQVTGGNQTWGVWLSDRSTNTLIAGNLFAGFSFTTRELSAVRLAASSLADAPQGTLIRGNIFGLPAGGQGPSGNSLYNTNAIKVETGSNTTIGGPSAADRNIISGSGYAPAGATYLTNVLAGVYVTGTDATGTTIEGNYIGLDIDGDPLGRAGGLAIGNLNYGVNLTTNSSGTVVRNNVIANSRSDGIHVSSGGNTIEGNRIGTNAAGTASDANFNNDIAGVRVDRGSGNIIRGNTIAAGASTLTAVLIKPFSNTSVTGTTVEGNWIGVNAGGASLTGGTAAQSLGILLDRADSPATGVASGATVSGNTIGSLEYGIKVEDAASPGHTLRANTIGPTSVASGIPGVNTGFGIWLLNATDTTIGGSAAADGNTIFGAGSHGIYLDGATSGGNRIQNNTVRNNGGNGVHVRGAAGIVIDRTATRGNTGAGIVLAEGGNGSIPAPTFGPSPFSGTPAPQLTVGVPGGACGVSGCKLQVFTSATSDPGEGPRFLAEADVAAGATSATVAVPACDRYLSATLRDVATGNTSPFSAEVDTGTGCGAASLTLSAGVRVAPGVTGTGPVQPGQFVVYEYTVTNGGGLPASVSVSRAPGGFPFSGPTPASFTLAGGASQTFQIRVDVPANAAGGAVDTFTVTATGGATPQTVNTSTTVAQRFGVDLAPEPPQDRTFASGGVTLSFTHLITNTGNGPDSFNVSASSVPALAGITVVPLTSCANVAANASCRVRVDVPIPAVAAAAYDITVTATSAGDPTKTDSAVNRAAGAAAAPGLTPVDQTKDALPGETVVFTRTVANIGTLGGTFTPALSVTPPEPGWNASLDSVAPFSLAPAATRVITHTVIVPPLSDTTPLSGTLVSALVSVTSSDSITASGTDTVRVRLLPRLELSAADTPQSAAPGATVVFTHTLKNTGNGPDSFTVVLTATAGLENVTRTPAGAIALARDETVDVVVRARVKDFQAPGPQSIEVAAQSLSSPRPAPGLQTDVVNVTAVAGISLSPAQRIAVSSVPATVTFTHTLTNVGNVSGDFAVAPVLVGGPAGWTLDPLAQNPPGCLAGLASGASCEFAVAVNVPASPLPANRDFGLRIDVTTSGASATVVDTVAVGPIAGVALAPDRAGSTAPDTPIDYSHTLTNTGNLTATFTLSVQSAPPGWPAPQLIPAVLPNVPPGITRTVTVRVTPPANALAGGPLDVVVRAQSSVAPSPTAQVTDSTTVLEAPAGRLTPATQTRSVFPTPSQPDTATFSMALANSGNTVISYTLGLVALDAPDWTALIAPTTTGLRPADVSATTPVTVTVRAPAGASGSRAFRVEARRGASGEVLATAVLTATTAAPITDMLTPLVNTGSAPPGGLLVYTHTLKNVRAISDTFQLTTIAPFGWETTVNPGSVFLPPGGTASVSVSIRVPTNVVSGTLDVTTLRATSVSDPSVTAAAQERTTVTRIATASLSPRFVQLGSQGQVIDFRHTLVNTGNAFDTFTVQAVSSLGWPVTVLNGTPTLAPAGFDNFITVRVTVPPGAPLGAVNRISVTATSAGASGVVSSVENVVALPPPVAPTVEYPLYLPLMAR